MGFDKDALVKNSMFELIRAFGFYLLSVASWRVKETERMIAICTELRKVKV